MRIAVLGAGRMGRLHARLLRDTPGVQGLLLADTDPDRARAVAAETGGTQVADAEAAIEAADAVVVATPPHTHAAIVRAAVERGRPTLCEKPLAGDVREARALAAFVEQRGILVQVGFHRRFDPAYAAARELVASGALGRLQLLRFAATEPVLPSSPLTNLFRNTAIHDFDLARWLSGSEVVSIQVAGSRRDGGLMDRRLDPDTLSATLQLASGALAAITVTRLSRLGYDVRAELVGDRDHVSIGWTGRTPIRRLEAAGNGGGGADPKDGWQGWEDRFEAAYREEIRAFLAVVRGEEAPRVTVRDGVVAQQIAEAARLAFETGTTVAPAP